jgi:hypothetical protein
LVEKTGIGAEGHDGARFVTVQKGSAFLLTEARQTAISRLLHGRAPVHADSQNRIHPDAIHYTIKLGKLA